MIEFISVYVKEIDKLYQTGLTTEHSFRPALAQLLQDCTRCTVINEQSHINCGAPDLTLLSKQLPVAYIEAKDLEDGDLDGRKKNKEQFDRYKASLDTIIFTDYLDFHLYEHGEWQQSVRLAEIQGNKIRLSDADRFIALMEHIKTSRPQSITSATKLAQLMAGKARLLRDIIEQALQQDGDKPTELRSYMETFRKNLLHDITTKQFADIYAQTVAYGMFAARIHDTTPNDFTRSEAANLIPKSNPFLRKVFQKIAGYDLDERIEWVVDELVRVFAATDIKKMRLSFDSSHTHKDPMIHFYEDFLYQYDPATKKQSGVYYTPQPVVEFIVRAVDDILKNDFGLQKGLADTSKVNGQHRVQILDPATGTGTFLAEVVNRIKAQQQEGMWTSYVDEHLIPRLYGFELMMAPYTIAHLKLDMLINWWNEKRLPVTHKDRLRIFLTNSLDQTELSNQDIFGNMVAQESNEANKIKHNAPVMIVMGNPPYSVSSNNKGEWINKLIDDYKKNLNERNIQPLSDDYIKFIRLAQYYVERNGEGIVAYISNNSFIDGLIHRQMRSELMRVFDKIYILDLHGNSRKKETCPDGSKDENVFDIMQGVSINIFIKKSAKSNKPADIYHYNLYGTRESKYAFLQKHDFANVEWQQLTPKTPSYFFVPKDFSVQEEYERGFKVDELMSIHVTGLKTQRDSASIFLSENEKAIMRDAFLNLSVEELKQKYGFDDGRDWQVSMAKKDLMTNPIIVNSILYRPFDFRYMLYTGKTKGIQGYPRYELMRHLINKKGNFGMLLTKQNRQISVGYYLVTDYIPDLHVLDSAADSMQLFPLYLYPENKELDFDEERIPNLNNAIWETIENWVQFGQSFAPNTSTENAGLLDFDKPEHQHILTPEQIFDYIYGILHSPAYRAKYKEFLKVDFPRIPYPKNADEFEHYRYYGNLLRELHLMHNLPDSHVTFPEAGSMLVEKVEWKDNRVYINATQYFDNVPREAWEMFIGGYQPAQKWLKDRRNRTLSYDDIQHYRNIVMILSETMSIMNRI